MIPQETIEQIREASDIVQIIGEFLRLKKRGRNYLALCPFHTEKTPSFNVSPDKQIFHCFGCGKGGNLFTFLMEHEKMSFVEAVQFLAKKANITIVEDNQSDYKKDLLDKLNYANQTALEYFQKVLHSSKYKSVLEKYLKYSRNIQAEAIEHFQLGLAGEEWDGFINYARKKDLSPDILDKAGLVLFSEKTKKHFDRFRQRLMIPIMNLSGRPIAFGGRTLKKGEPAKYMNSPETALYSKSNILYGLNLAKDYIRDSKTVYIVEGYFDVISLWQIGIKNVVASSGTAFTSQQARLLARFAETAYLFFDSDSAGRTAALRSVDSLYDAGMEVKIIQPIAGEDPDTIAKKYGKEKIEEIQQEAVGFIQFRIFDIDIEKSGIIGKEKLIKEFAAIGQKINDPTRRTLFFADAAERLNTSPQIFSQTAATKNEDHELITTRQKRHNKIEISLLSLLFSNPSTIESILETISADDFDSKQLSRLYSAIIQQYKTDNKIDARKMIDNTTDLEFVSLITQVAGMEWEPDQIDSEVSNFVVQFKVDKRKRQIQKLKLELPQAEADGDQNRIDEILDEIKSLSKNA